MDRTLDESRIRAAEREAGAEDESGAPGDHSPADWVVDMKSHRVVRRRLARRAERQGAIHSER